MDNKHIFYRLTLGHFIAEKQPNDLILEQGNRIQFDDKDKKVSYYVTLLGVKANRKIYQPTEIEAEIDFMQKTTDSTETEKTQAPSFEAVSDLLLKRTAKLEIVHRKDDTTFDSDRAYTIAENCYVFGLNPQLKRDVNGVKMSVRMNIFSMDKLMTLNKYSKAYVARKLGSGILKPESLTFGKDPESKAPLVKTNIKDMRFLKYEEQFIVPDDNGKQTVATIPSEFIQPYLVQYNESFYDFLVRTANRCGEFLYFEDGELTLGLPDSGTPLMIDDFESVTVQSVTPAPFDIPVYARDSAKEGIGAPKHMNWTPIDKSDSYPKDAFPENTSYNSEMATDEYIFPLYKDKATDLAREMMYDGGHRAAIFKVMKVMKTMASSTKSGGKTAIDTVIKAGVPEAIQSFFVNLKANKINKKLNSTFINPMKGNSEQCDGDKVVQFGTLSEKGWTSLNYYRDIRRHEEMQQQKIICINMSTNFYPVKLGQKIGIPGSDKTYVVIQIVQNTEGEWQHDYETYNGRPAEHTSTQRTMKIFAIPSYEGENKKECFIPPVQPVPVIRKSGPQTAFVVASNDPKYQGRVRITYPWQSLGTQIQERLDAATSALEEARGNQERLTLRTEQLRKEYQQLVIEEEEMEKWARMSDAEREIRRKELEDEIKTLEQSIQNREDAISQANKAVRDKESEIDNLPADTENREARLTELEEEKQILILRKSDTIQENEPKMAEEKELLARKKAHLAELAKVEDKSKKDAVINEKQNELNSVADDLKISENQEKAAKNDVKAKEKAKDKAEDDKKKKLESIATPWIRIATPVATEGGGFFYEPRMGDEVLVNFDNDNVERPYVVGQLYSKETLDPRERMNRKLNTKSLGTMALVSPNGHHIAFNDPEDGSKFLNGVVPVVGGINKFATLGIPVVSPFFNLSALHPKTAKDLTGGIHIGDRYGLYEISMSSDGRKINISSPLGQVNLNAFTGISIDAPNGDIKIRGKNVNISAGNKVTIESGTNIGLGGGIGGPDYQWIKGERWWGWTRFSNWNKTMFHALGHEILLQIAPEGGKQAYKEAIPLVNVEFFRYLTQVFLRPIDGTMLIKSRKYMLLEAGKGKAMVKADRYKKKKPDDYFRVFESLIACVDFIQNGLQDFYDKYDDLWGKAYNAKITWDKWVEYRIEKQSIPDVLKIAWQFDTTKDWDATPITDLLVRDKFKSAIRFVGGTKTIEDTKQLANAYGEAVYNLHKHVLTITGLMKNLYNAKATVLEWVFKILNTIVDDANLLAEWKKVYVTDTGDATKALLSVEHPKDIFTEGRTEFKRRTAARFLLNFSGSDENKAGHYIHIAYDERHFAKDAKWWKLKGSKYGKEKLSKDYYWKRFVQNMDRYIQNSNFWRVFAMSFADTFWNDKFKKDLWTTTDIWDKDQGGQILMSDNEDYTLNIVKDGVQSEDAGNQFNLNRLTRKLYDIK